LVPIAGVRFLSQGGETAENWRTFGTN
jgi:hypothetical protein